MTVTEVGATLSDLHAIAPLYQFADDDQANEVLARMPSVQGCQSNASASPQRYGKADVNCRYL